MKTPTWGGRGPGLFAIAKMAGGGLVEGVLEKIHVRPWWRRW